MRGAQLQRVRLAARVSQTELARELGQHQMWVSRMEAKSAVHPASAEIFLAGIEALLQRREESRHQLARGLADLAAAAGAR